MNPPGCAQECRGCKYRELSEEESNTKKRAWAEACLGHELSQKITGFSSPKQRLGYRQKTLLHAQPVNNHWNYGLLKRTGWEFEVIPIPDCPVHGVLVNRIFQALFSFLPMNAPLTFVQVAGSQLSLVLKTKRSDIWPELLLKNQKILEEAGATSVFINWNPSAGRRVFAARFWQLVFGSTYSKVEDVFYGAMSFRQQLQELEQKVFLRSLDFFRPLKPDWVIDLYSGVGAGMRYWEREKWNTLGVELNGDAVEASKLNLLCSKILVGKVEQRIPQLKALPFSSAVVYTNPPRTGHNELVNAWINSDRRIKAMVYLSCNVKTLKRDLDSLSENFLVSAIQLYDFFPQTDHVEAQALLIRK